MRAVLVILLCLASVLPARADDALARVKQRGELVVFSDATYPPFETVEGEKIVGFDADVAAEIGKELGVKVRQENIAWDGIFPALETGKCDLILSGVTITDERKKGNSFTRPYFLSGQVVVRRKGDTRIGGPDDLAKPGITTAVQQETTGQFAVEKRGVPKDRIHRFDALPDALLDVRNKNSDAAVGDLPALAALIRKGYAGELEILPGGPFVSENLGIVARRDARDLVAAVNAALEEMLVDGRYAAIYARWMGEPATSAMIGELARVAKEGTAIPADIAARVAGGGAVVAGAEPAQADARSALSIRGDVLGQVFPLLVRGARITLALTLLTLCLGVPLGLLLALARLSSVAPVRWAAGVYIEAVRGTPLLMQIYVIYFVLPALVQLLPPPWDRWLNLSAFAAGLTALTLNSAAYVAEIFRAGIESIDGGQREAARALGMSGAQSMQYVVLPQTVRRVLPPLTNEAIALLKDSSLVSVVGLAELMRIGREQATNTGAPITVYLAVALIYLAMTLPLTSLVRRLEARWQPISRPRAKARPAAPAATGS